MTGTRGGAAGRDAGESRQDPLPKLARVRATGLAAAAVGLLTVGALGSSSDIAATVEISVAALILIVALDQRPGLVGPRLLVGKLTPRSLARLVTAAMVTFGLVLAVDWALGERFDGLSVGLGRALVRRRRAGTRVGSASRRAPKSRPAIDPTWSAGPQAKLSARASSTVAFVLSGGASLGAIQAGMLKALYARGTALDLLVGASVGALDATFIASRPQASATAAALADVWLGLERSEVFPLNPVTGLVGFFGRRNYLVPDGHLRRLVREHLELERLEDADLPLHVIATDLTTGREVRLSRGDALEAVMASTAIPGSSRQWSGVIAS